MATEEPKDPVSKYHNYEYFMGTDGYEDFVQYQRQKQKDTTNRNGSDKKGQPRWFDWDGNVWHNLGKPLRYRASEYIQDHEISCSYCGKFLAMWHGSPDLSATDVCCFECFAQRNPDKK